MPPPATATALPSYERSLRILPAPVVKGTQRTATARPNPRRVVHDKDFLQRLREAGL